MKSERSFRPSVFADATWMAELRAVVMRPDLERLGRYDPDRVRQRFLDAFTPAHTRVIQVKGIDVGLVAMRPEPDGVWIEHFYLDPEWLATSIEPNARVTGAYWHHGRRRAPHEAVGDTAFQDDLLAVLAAETGETI